MIPPRSGAEITQLLFASSEGDEDATEHLLNLLYGDLHRLARRQLAGEGAEMTLTATALVNEAYLRLLTQTGGAWTDRQHFFRLIARAMRRIAVDHARKRLAQKRGGEFQRVDTDTETLSGDDRASMLLELEDALETLRAEDERLFGGLTEDETADALDVSRRTVQRDWERARERLQDLLG